MALKENVAVVEVRKPFDTNPRPVVIEVVIGVVQTGAGMWL